MTDQSLLDQFVASFGTLDGDMCASREIFPIAWELRDDESHESGEARWRPAKLDTSPSSLDPLYAKLPARFPPLYERLVLSYRWAEVDLGICRLLANPLGPDLSRLFSGMMLDKALGENLLPAGYIQFGKGPDMEYDPVCFDIGSRSKLKDYRIVKIDHEEILCHGRVKVVAELAPSFRRFVLQTIERANRLSANTW
jgi:hypothetical protein